MSAVDGESLAIGQSVDIYIDDQIENDAFSLLQDGSATGQLLLSTYRQFGPETEIRVEVDAVQGTQTGGTLPSTVQSVRVYNHTIKTTADRRVIDTPGFVALQVGDAHSENNDGVIGQSLRILDADETVIETVQTGVGSQIAIVDMGDYKTGIYTIIAEDGAETTMMVYNLGLDIVVDRQTVTVGSALRGHVAATIETPRVMTVTLITENDTPIAETTATITANGTGIFSINTTAVSNADTEAYRLLVTDPQTNLQVASEPVRFISSTGVGFTQATYADARGDIMEIPLSVGTEHAATVMIGNSSSNIQANVTVQDRTGDGIVTLRFNTDAAIASALDKSERAVFTVKPVSADDQSSGDNHDIIHSTNPSATMTTRIADNAVPLSEKHYPVSIKSEATETAFTNNTAMIRIDSPTIETLQVYTAPRGMAFSSVEQITNAIDNEQMTPTGSVASGDVIIYALTAEGFEGRTEQAEEQTIRTFERTATKHANRYQTPSLSVTYPNATPSVSNQLNNSWVMSNTSNHQYYIGATAGTRTNTASEQRVNDSAGTHFTATLQPGTRIDDARPSGSITTPGEHLDNSESSSVGKAQKEPSGDWTVQTAVVPQQIVFDTNQTRVAPVSDQYITGTTTVAPGSIMTITLRANASKRQSGGTYPLDKTIRTTIGINRTWSGAFDFSTFDIGQSFVIHSVISQSDSVITQNRMRGYIEVSPADADTVVAKEKTGASGGGGGGGGITGILTGLLDSGSERINPEAQPSDTVYNGNTTGAGSVVDGIITGSFIDTELGRVVDNTVKSSIQTRLMNPVAAGFILILSIVSLLLYRRR
jgi:hypothetical protein